MSICQCECVNMKKCLMSMCQYDKMLKCQNMSMCQYVNIFLYILWENVGIQKHQLVFIYFYSTPISLEFDFSRFFSSLCDICFVWSEYFIQWFMSAIHMFNSILYLYMCFQRQQLNYINILFEDFYLFICATSFLLQLIL